jgi:hypothetical protein
VGENAFPTPHSIPESRSGRRFPIGAVVPVFAVMVGLAFLAYYVIA